MPRRFVILVLAIVSLVVLAPTTYASAPNPNSTPTGQAQGSKTQQDPQWLKAKFGYRVFSGVIPGQGKGVHTHPSILSTPFFNPLTTGGSLTPNTAPPSSYTLGSAPQYDAEPSDGKYYNFPESNWLFTYDDAYHHYADGNMYSLCGPGAADVATTYWPWPPNYADYANVTDSLANNEATSWNSSDVDGTQRMRGYMVHLAFAVKAPTWTKYGMLPQTYVQTSQVGGTTLQVVRDALNWEASGENTSNWSSYFYANDWNNNYTSESAVESALHNDIVSDLWYNNVPVIVEISAKLPYLPNWPNGTGVNHFVTIVGYDDVQGTYKYVDTCKSFTNCNYRGIDTPDFHPVSQHDLADGVWNIHTNKTTGDGGWVW